jgi:hypothetical protein
MIHSETVPMLAIAIKTPYNKSIHPTAMASFIELVSASGSSLIGKGLVGINLAAGGLRSHEPQT